MSLEKNIERIADALEAIAGSAEGKAGVYKTPGMPSQGSQQAPPAMPQGNGQASVQQNGSRIPVSLPAGQWPAAPAQQQSTPMQQPGSTFQQPGVPFQQPAGPGMAPTATASAKQYTFDQLAVATANLASSGKDVFTVLGRFGVSMLMDLPQERYGEYAAALREAGAVI